MVPRDFNDCFTTIETNLDKWLNRSFNIFRTHDIVKIKHKNLYRRSPRCGNPASAGYISRISSLSSTWTKVLWVWCEGRDLTGIKTPEMGSLIRSGGCKDIHSLWYLICISAARLQSDRAHFWDCIKWHIFASNFGVWRIKAVQRYINYD